MQYKYTGVHTCVCTCRQLCQEDAKWPDGMTLIHWEEGRPLMWNFTSCSTLAQLHPARAERGPGVVANLQMTTNAGSMPPPLHRIYLPLFASNLWEPGGITQKFSYARLANELKRTQGSPDQLHSSFKDLQWMSIGQCCFSSDHYPCLERLE